MLSHEEFNNEITPKSEISTRVSSLFKYIQELNKLKQKTILNIKDYRWQLWCSDLPDDPDNIKLIYQDRTDEDSASMDGEQDNILLAVHKEDFQSCPVPPDSLIEWLKNDGWKDYRHDVEYFEEKIVKEIDPETKEEVEKTITFDEDSSRVQDAQTWAELRNPWVEDQERIAMNRDVFDKIYSEYYALKRDGELEEVIVANGIFLQAGIISDL